MVAPIESNEREMAYVINNLHRREGQLLRRGLSVDCIKSDSPTGRLRKRGPALHRPGGGIDCDACVEACPVDGRSPGDMVPPEWQRFIEINANYYKDKWSSPRRRAGPPPVTTSVQFRGHNPTG